jgi:hypothetical protein
VAEILERAGAPRLMGLLADLGTGADFDRAFTSWVQMPFADFERGWFDAVRTANSRR